MEFKLINISNHVRKHISEEDLKVLKYINVEMYDSSVCIVKYFEKDLEEVINRFIKNFIGGTNTPPTFKYNKNNLFINEVWLEYEYTRKIKKLRMYPIDIIRETRTKKHFETKIKFNLIGV